MSQVIRRKLLPKDIEDADANILNISFELIHGGQYELAKEILDFCEKYLKKFSSDDIKLRLMLNRAQSYKWLGEEAKCIEIIHSIDWSACKNLFKLGRHVLLNEYEEAALIMDDLGKDSKEIDKADYNDWPIFKEFIKQAVFKRKFAEIYGQEPEIIERYAPSGFKIVSRTTFLEKLDHCLTISAEKQQKFLSSKFFVETNLAQNGFDIANSWDLYHQLETENVIETYKHIDPNDKYPPISAVRRKVVTI